MVLLNSLTPKVLSTKYERKKRENPSEIEKELDEDAMWCNTLWSHTSQKTFLTFSRTSKRRH